MAASDRPPTLPRVVVPTTDEQAACDRYAVPFVAVAGGPSTVADPVALLTAVDFGLAGVVLLEAAVRLVGSSGGVVDETATGYRLIRPAETVVASCVVGVVLLWLVGALGGRNTEPSS